MVPDGIVDFAFSFDSLVHADADILEAYLEQLARKLTHDGVGFVHHSNMGAYPFACAIARQIPERFGDAAWQSRLLRICGISHCIDPRTFLDKHGMIINVGSWRCRKMTAERFAEACRRVDLACIYQEKIAWVWGRYLTDCLSIFTRRNSNRYRPNLVLENRKFTRPNAGTSVPARVELAGAPREGN